MIKVKKATAKRKRQGRRWKAYPKEFMDMKDLFLSLNEHRKMKKKFAGNITSKGG